MRVPEAPIAVLLKTDPTTNYKIRIYLLYLSLYLSCTVVGRDLTPVRSDATARSIDTVPRRVVPCGCPPDRNVTAGGDSLSIERIDGRPRHGVHATDPARFRATPATQLRNASGRSPIHELGRSAIRRRRVARDHRRDGISTASTTCRVCARRFANVRPRNRWDLTPSTRSIADAPAPSDIGREFQRGVVGNSPGITACAVDGVSHGRSPHSPGLRPHSHSRTGA